MRKHTMKNIPYKYWKTNSCIQEEESTFHGSDMRD